MRRLSCRVSQTCRRFLSRYAGCRRSIAGPQPNGRHHSDAERDLPACAEAKKEHQETNDPKSGAEQLRNHGSNLDLPGNAPTQDAQSCDHRSRCFRGSPKWRPTASLEPRGCSSVWAAKVVVYSYCTHREVKIALKLAPCDGETPNSI